MLQRPQHQGFDPYWAAREALDAIARRRTVATPTGHGLRVESQANPDEPAASPRFVMLVGRDATPDAVSALVGELRDQLAAARVYRFVATPLVSIGGTAVVPPPPPAAVAAFTEGTLTLPDEVVAFDYPLPNGRRRLLLARRATSETGARGAVATREFEFGGLGEVAPMAVESVVEVPGPARDAWPDREVLGRDGRPLEGDARVAQVRHGLSKRVRDPLGAMAGIAAQLTHHEALPGRDTLSKMTMDVELAILLLAMVEGAGDRVERQEDGTWLVRSRDRVAREPDPAPEEPTPGPAPASGRATPTLVALVGVAAAMATWWVARG